MKITAVYWYLCSRSDTETNSYELTSAGTSALVEVLGRSGGARPGGVVLLTMLFRGVGCAETVPGLKYNSSHERMCNTTNAAEAHSRKRRCLLT
jgi:hypothetical protein